MLTAEQRAYGSVNAERIARSLIEANCFAIVGDAKMQQQAEEQALRFVRKLASDLGFVLEPKVPTRADVLKREFEESVAAPAGVTPEPSPELQRLREAAGAQ